MKKIIETIRGTQVLNGSKYVFTVFYLLTCVMNLADRKYRPLGLLLKNIFSHLPQLEFEIENEIGKWIVTPFNDTMVISAPYFEKETEQWLDKKGEKRLFVDIGANIGRYTLLAHKKGYEAILAIEAHPDTYKKLKKNVFLNDLGKKSFGINKAVGHYKGLVKIVGDPHHMGGARIVDRVQAGEKVNIDTLDNIFKDYNFENIDFIKIDVEGCEHSVVQGMREVMKKMPSQSRIMIEICDDYKLDLISEVMSEHGFFLRELTLHGDDYLFIKR